MGGGGGQFNLAVRDVMCMHMHQAPVLGDTFR